LLKTSGTKFILKPCFTSVGFNHHEIPHGLDIKTFNLERTICDVLRSRNQMDVQFVNEALKRYVNKKEKNMICFINMPRNLEFKE